MNVSCIFLAAVALFQVLTALTVNAKTKDREAPRAVSPVVIEGRRYEALHWGQAQGLPQNGGYVVAIDVATGRELWRVRIYPVIYKRGQEGDKEDVFITELQVERGGRSLVISNERGGQYRLDLKTRKVEGK